MNYSKTGACIGGTVLAASVVAGVLYSVFLSGGDPRVIAGTMAFSILGGVAFAMWGYVEGEKIDLQNSNQNNGEVDIRGVAQDVVAQTAEQSV